MACFLEVEALTLRIQVCGEYIKGGQKGRSPKSRVWSREDARYSRCPRQKAPLTLPRLIYLILYSLNLFLKHHLELMVVGKEER